MEFEMSESYLKPKLGEAMYADVVSQIKELLVIMEDGHHATITKIY